MRDLYRAYSAVHDTTIKEELDTSKDQISAMNLGQLTEGDLLEVCEEIVEGLFQYGCDLDSAYDVVGSMMEATTEGELPAHRQQKIVRISEAFDKTFEKVATRAERNCEEEFLKYRTNKPLNEKWNSRVNNEVGNEKLHAALIHEDRETIKGGLIEMISKVIEEKKDSSYLETDMKKREKNNEKARKDMEKVPGQKNPHFEEVSTLRQGWGDAYDSIYEKKLDPVGQEDGDVDNDGDEDSSDEYLKKKRKAIGNAMKKEGFIPIDKAKQQKIDNKIGKTADKEAIESGRRPRDRDDKKIDKLYNRQIAMKFKKKMKKEEVSFSETELKAFEEIVNSWVD
jgi:hypothetical protein